MTEEELRSRAFVQELMAQRNGALDQCAKLTAEIAALQPQVKALLIQKSDTTQ